MSNQLFQAPSQISGISTLKDKTLKLTVYISKELPAEQKTMLFDLEQKEGWFLFSPNELQMKDIPEVEAEAGIKQKSPTERLYNVLFVYWQQNYSHNSNFQEWRAKEMERLIEAYKSKLLP